MTVDQFIAKLTKDGKRPDDFRFMVGRYIWFRPYYRSRFFWHGLDQDNHSRIIDCDAECGLAEDAYKQEENQPEALAKALIRAFDEVLEKYGKLRQED